MQFKIPYFFELGFNCSGLFLSKSVWQSFHGESKLMTLNMLLGPILSVIQCVLYFHSVIIWRAILQFDLAIVFSLHDILTHYLHALCCSLQYMEPTCTMLFISLL